jgi:hypothetical protein
LLFHGFVLHLGKSKLFKERSYQKVESCSQSALFFCLFLVFSLLCIWFDWFFFVPSVWSWLVLHAIGICSFLWASCVRQTSFFLLICVWIWRRLLRAWFFHDLARVFLVLKASM